MAKGIVSDRERVEGKTLSNPQMFVGEAMRKKLASLEKRLASGAAKERQRNRVSSVRTSESRMVLVKGR